MNRCSALTSKGSQCKQGRANCLNTCWIHSDSCSVCLEKLGTKDEVAVVKCGHKFHAGCIDKWRQMDKCRCPMCRKMIFTPDEVTIRVPRKFYDNQNLRTFVQYHMYHDTLVGERLLVEYNSDDETLVIIDEYTMDYIGVVSAVS